MIPPRTPPIAPPTVAAAPALDGAGLQTVFWVVVQLCKMPVSGHELERKRKTVRLRLPTVHVTTKPALGADAIVRRFARDLDKNSINQKQPPKHLDLRPQTD
jgi:hypothetical protein